MSDFVIGSLVTRMKMDSTEFNREKARAEKSIERTIAAMEHEKRVLEQGAASAREYAYTLSGVSQERIQYANKLIAKVEELRKAQERPVSGGGIADLLGKQSQLGQVMAILRGGGAIAGVTMLAKQFSAITEAIVEARNNQDGLKSDALKTIPIVGELYSGFKNVGELIWHGAEGMAKLEKEAAALKSHTDFMAKAEARHLSVREGDTSIGSQRLRTMQEAEAARSGIFEQLTEASKRGDNKAIGELLELKAQLEEDIQLQIDRLDAKEAHGDEATQIKEKAKAIEEAREAERMAFEEAQTHAKWRREEMDAETKAINKRNKDRIAKQYADVLEREVETPKRFREGLRRYAAHLNRQSETPLVGGDDAYSIEAQTRITKHSMEQPKDTQIEQAMLALQQEEVAAMRDLRDAIMAYIEDPDKGFRI